MSGINIPGVTDKYNTGNTIEKLMQVERIPLTREQKTLDNYKIQQTAWRDVNRKVSTLRDSTKSLYSFDNPFNSKLTSSTDEYAITATASRSAPFDSFKIDVIQPATADRFLSAELDEKMQVPEGNYTYKIAEKKITIRWKGGSLKDFSESINRRGNDLIKSRLIGASKGKKTLSIESQKTGNENRLIFEDDAKTFAKNIGMITEVKAKSTQIASLKTDFLQPTNQNEVNEQKRMPKLSSQGITVNENIITVPPRGGFYVKIPSNTTEIAGNHIEFTVIPSKVEDITVNLNKAAQRPELPNSGSASFKDITIFNASSDTAIPQSFSAKPEPLEEIITSEIVYAVMSDGSEKLISPHDILSKSETKINIELKDYKGISGITIRNKNTGYSFNISTMSVYNPNESLGFMPQNAISTADDAIIKYEGITIKRPSNEIDDVVPEVTLNIHERTEKTATIKISPDTEAAKNALITFVGQYNQAISEINILAQTKPEIIDELDYLSEEEKKEKRSILGLFSSDSTLTGLKSNMQSTTTARYPFSENAQITMLSQIGIATNATNYSGYTPSKLRGYLEIDEKKLDQELEKNLDDIKKLFGYDSDGDSIIDSGIGFRLDKQLTAYVQTGGIFTLKTSGLDTKIKSSEKRISKLELQMKDKEAELKMKYGQMEGALNSLENQQSAISNFSRKNNNNN